MTALVKMFVSSSTMDHESAIGRSKYSDPQSRWAAGLRPASRTLRHGIRRRR